MQIRNSKLCEASECWAYSAANHTWWVNMLFHRRGLLWLGSAVRCTCAKWSNQNIHLRVCILGLLIVPSFSHPI